MPMGDYQIENQQIGEWLVDRRPDGEQRMGDELLAGVKQGMRLEARGEDLS